MNQGIGWPMLFPEIYNNQEVYPNYFFQWSPWQSYPPFIQAAEPLSHIPTSSIANVLYCAKCKNHGKQVPTRGCMHKWECPFECCPCDECKYVDKYRQKQAGLRSKKQREKDENNKNPIKIEVVEHESPINDELLFERENSVSSSMPKWNTQIDDFSSDFVILDYYLHNEDVTFEQYEQMEYERINFFNESSIKGEEELTSPLFAGSSTDECIVKKRYCNKCANHGAEVFFNGKRHLTECPFELCNCNACLYVEKLRNRMRASRLKKRLKDRKDQADQSTAIQSQGEWLNSFSAGHPTNSFSYGYSNSQTEQSPPIEIPNNSINPSTELSNLLTAQQPFCGKCRNHGKKSPTRKNLHTEECPYKDCPCGACLLMERKRKMDKMYYFKRLGNNQDMESTSSLEKKQLALSLRGCGKCANHSITFITRWPNHKNICPFETCPCYPCSKVEMRRSYQRGEYNKK